MANATKLPKVTVWHVIGFGAMGVFTSVAIAVIRPFPIVFNEGWMVPVQVVMSGLIAIAIAHVLGKGNSWRWWKYFIVFLTVSLGFFWLTMLTGTLPVGHGQRLFSIGIMVLFAWCAEGLVAGKPVGYDAWLANPDAPPPITRPSSNPATYRKYLHGTQIRLGYWAFLLIAGAGWLLSFAAQYGHSH